MTLLIVPDNLGYPKKLPERFLAGFDEVHHYNDLPDAEEFVKRSKNADGLIFAWVKLSPKILDACPKLKVASFMGVGASNYVDLAYARRRGITICNTPGYGNSAVAEMTLALILALARKVVPADKSLREGRWEQERLEGVGLDGKTIGIVGLGGVGEHVAKIASALGMRVICTTAHPSDIRAKKAGVEFVALERLLMESDVVSLHAMLNSETKGMIGAEQLALMKPSSFLVNLARAELVDTQALARALADGKIAGAGTDVWEQEPPSKGNPLLGLENTILTPHIGWNADTAKWRMLEIAVENIRSYFQGKPQNVITS